LSKKKILIIDDEKKIIELLKVCLEGEYDIIEAYEGKMGLELAEKDSIDIIILDIMLGDIDGLKIYEKLRKIEKLKSIPILFLSGRPLSSEVEIKENEYYLNKPFSLVKLRTIIKNLLLQ